MNDKLFKNSGSSFYLGIVSRTCPAAGMLVSHLPKFLLNFAMPSVLKGTVSKGKINLHPYINYFFHNSGVCSFRVIHLFFISGYLKFDGGIFGKCRLGRMRRRIKLRLIVRG